MQPCARPGHPPEGAGSEERLDVTAAAPGPFGLDGLRDCDAAERGPEFGGGQPPIAPAVDPEVALPPPLRRSVLLDEMPEEQFLKVVEATRGLLNRRFDVAKKLV